MLYRATCLAFPCFLFTVEKVIILVCNGQSITDTYNEFIRQINKLEKTFVAQVNNGKLPMDPDIFCSQVFNLPMTYSTPNTQFISQEQDVNADSLCANSYKLSKNYPEGNSSERKSIDDMSAQNSQQLVLATVLRKAPSCCCPKKFDSSWTDILSGRGPSNMEP